MFQIGDRHIFRCIIRPDKKSPAKRSFHDLKETLPDISAHSIFQIESNKRFAGLLVTYSSPQ